MLRLENEANWSETSQHGLKCCKPPTRLGRTVIRGQWRVSPAPNELNWVWCLWRGHWWKVAKFLTSSFCTVNLNLQHVLLSLPPPPPYVDSNLSLLAPCWIFPSSLALSCFFFPLALSLFSSICEKTSLAASLAWKVATAWRDNSGNWLKVDWIHRGTKKDTSLTCPVGDVSPALNPVWQIETGTKQAGEYL